MACFKLEGLASICHIVLHVKCHATFDALLSKHGHWETWNVLWNYIPGESEKTLGICRTVASH